MMFEAMTVARDRLLEEMKASRANTLRAIQDAETDSLTRFEKLRKDTEAEFDGFVAIVHETYGAPADESDAVEADFVVK